MYLTLRIKLDRSNELIQTAKIWNAACQDVIDYGYAAHDYKKNKKLGKWSFAELRCIIEYKAAVIGKIVVAIDPRYTSRTCSHCGFQKKENRNGRTFRCQSCGFQIDADLNASRNIATFSRSDRSRLSVNQPIVAG